MPEKLPSSSLCQDNVVEAVYNTTLAARIQFDILSQEEWKYDRRLHFCNRD